MEIGAVLRQGAKGMQSRRLSPPHGRSSPPAETFPFHDSVCPHSIPHLHPVASVQPQDSPDRPDDDGAVGAPRHKDPLQRFEGEQEMHSGGRINGMLA